MHTTQPGCRVCGAPTTGILHLGTTPLANDFPDQPDADQARYPLDLYVCNNYQCRMVQLGEVVPDELIWTDRYAFYSSTSPQLVAYHATLAELLKTRWRAQAEQGVVEIGSNDGSLLRHFAAEDWPVLGLDPSVGPADAANSRGVRTQQRAFSRAVADEIRGGRGRVGLIIANHVLAHCADILDVMHGIATLLTDDGVAVVEVQNLADLIAGNRFDHIYHEHRYYLSVRSITYLAHKAGLAVHSVEHVNVQGESLRVTLHRGGEYTPPAADGWLRGPWVYSGLQARAGMIAERLQQVVRQQLDEGRMVVGYGAPAKATTLVHWAGLRPDMIAWIEDTTPAKIGRFLPGTSIPVVESRRPLKSGASYLVFAHNYLPSILRRHVDWYADGGRFIIPVPMPVVL